MFSAKTVDAEIRASLLEIFFPLVLLYGDNNLPRGYEMKHGIT